MCGIIRTYELQGLNSKSDYSYETVSLVIWSASELLITIICANIPMLRPLWSQLRGHKSSSYGLNADSPGPNSGNMMPGRNHHYSGNPTIGGGGGGRKRSKDLSAWNELGDIDSVRSGEEGLVGGKGAFASKLGGPRQGKNETVVKGSFVDNEDARSSDSILREERVGSGGGAHGAGMRGIEVHKQYEVRGGSVSGVGRAW